MDNKTNVELINNKLFSHGVTIYENNPMDLLHASGHACQEDLKLLLTIVSPRFFIPCHGEHYMLQKHAQLAKEVGVPTKNVFVCKNGDVVSYRQGEFFFSKEKIETTPTYILEQKIVSNEELTKNFGLRSSMSEGGVVVVVLFKRENVFELPCIFTYGFLKVQKSKNIIEW